jgi:hypothetical protein
VKGETAKLKIEVVVKKKQEGERESGCRRLEKPSLDGFGLARLIDTSPQRQDLP